MTVEPFRKFVPVTVRVKSEAPAAMLLGLRVPTVGAWEVSVTAADVAPPFGFLTVTFKLPALDSALDERVAVMDVAVPAVTVNAVLPT